MHLYIFVRGKFEQVELWKSLVQSAFWKWRRINQKTDKEEITLVQGALRPSVFGAYEYVFPKEALAEVCSFLGITANESYGFGKIGLYGRHLALRKIFGAKKIPKKILEEAKTIPETFTMKEFERGVANCIIPGVAIHVIGIKKDVSRVMKGTDYYQEML